MDLEQMLKDKFPKKQAKTQATRPDGTPVIITWVAHWRAWTAYNLLFPGQTCDRLEERGGFTARELNTFYPEWKNHIINSHENI